MLQSFHQRVYNLQCAGKENPAKKSYGKNNNTKLVSKCFAYVFDVLVIGCSVKVDLLLTITMFAFKLLKKMTKKRRAELAHKEFLKLGNIETFND